MKTKAHNAYRKIIIIACLVAGVNASAASTYDCLRELMPLTERGNYQPKRKSVEAPFVVDGNYLVFPDISGGQLSGFYFYKGSQAWHFDAVVVNGKKKQISELQYKNEIGMIKLVAQPEGLETVALYYMPGYDPYSGNKEGPVMLGASVLPVVGALVSRPNKAKLHYVDPKQATDDRLKAWIFNQSTGRKPASADDIKLNQTLMHMASQEKMDESALWKPIKEELYLRRNWLKISNLDDATFRKFTHAMQTTCKE